MHTWRVVAAGSIWVMGVSVSALAEDTPVYTTLASLPSHLSSQAALGQPSGPCLLDRLASTYTTPQAVAKFLREEFTFKRDEELFGEADHWQSPEEFAARRVGDCEDYALLAQTLLRRNGIEAYVVSLFGEEGYAHTVSVFVDEAGRYNVINQDKIRYYHAKSLEALASALYPGWTFGGIAEQDGTHGRFVKEIHNPTPLSSLASDDLAQVF